MRKEENFMLCTAKELAQYITNKIHIKEEWNGVSLYNLYTYTENFPNCDFAIAKIEENADNSLESISERSEGWYGIKAIDAGFDSTDLLLICDYYTGGCPQMLSIYEGKKKDDVVEGIYSLIKNILKIMENFSDNTELIVEFL